MIRLPGKFKAFKKLLSVFMIIALLCSGIPCNCIAQPVKNSHAEKLPPCHSSSDTSKDNTKHKHCCCKGSDIKSLADSDSLALEIKEIKLPKITSYLAKNVFSVNYLAKNIKAIRGSPPGFDFTYSLSKNSLALLERWLI